MAVRLELRLGTAEALAREVDQNLARGRAFVPGASGLSERQAVTLAVVRPQGDELALEAEVVWLAPHGVGLSLGVDASMRERLRAFAAGSLEPPRRAPAPSAPHEPHEPHEGAALEPDDVRDGGGGPEGEGSEEERQRHRNVHERVRALSARERDDLARRGGMVERVALERAYGSAVWEPLLANPQVSGIEIARIARNGALPRPLVALIVSNAAWLTQGEVQRALLSNPRCGGRELERVLAVMKPADVSRIARGQSPYRPEVRQAAQRLAKV
jgi:hypothetical protein